ncbi:hypothetical protein FRC02_001264 [Tulasnella sp. 418]|nr:hypothetical protein FRC02_001264 [Tulasnella sp. 418]
MAFNSNTEDPQVEQQHQQSVADGTSAKDANIEQGFPLGIGSRPTVAEGTSAKDTNIEQESPLEIGSQPIIPEGIHNTPPNVHPRPALPVPPLPAVPAAAHNGENLEPQLKKSNHGRREVPPPASPTVSHHDQDPEVGRFPRTDLNSKPVQDANVQQSELPLTLDQFLPFWRDYNEDSEAQDKEIVDILGSDLDGLLIFAGLFSASNVAFILEAYKDLKEDQAQTTNELLRVLIHNQGHPANQISPSSPSFAASSYTTTVNALFFASLCCSLFTAFGAVLGKQWLNHYKKEGKRMTPANRARERQRKFMGLDYWHLEQVVETLPILLQISLFFFLAALVGFIWPLDSTVAGVITMFSIISVGFLIITTVISVVSPSAPFQTRFSAVIYEICKFTHNCFHRLSIQIHSALSPFHECSLDSAESCPTEILEKREKDRLSLHCISWILTTSSDDQTLSLAATAALLLPGEVWGTIPELGSQVSTVLRLVLRARASDQDSIVFLNVPVENLKGILEHIHTLVSRWDLKEDLVLPDLLSNDAFIVAFENLLWKVFRGYPGDKKAAMWIWRTLRRLGFQVEPNSQDIDILYREAVRKLEPSEHLVVVLGSAILLEHGLHFLSMRTLLRLPRDMEVSDFERILDPLQDFLIISENRFCGLVHSSARFFFTDRSRCQDQRFQVDPISTHTDLALKCIIHMKASLKRNMLGIARPTVLNTDVPHLKQFLQSEVSESLEYACLHWATHLQYAPPTDQTLREAIKSFSKTALLPWLEVMSLSNWYEQAISQINLAESWILTGKDHDEATTLIQEMRRFIVLFREPVQQSAAALYSIALPMTRPSLLHENYIAGEPQLSMQVKLIGQPNFWSSVSQVQVHDAHNVNAVLLSRDGKHLISAYSDSVVRRCLSSGRVSLAKFQGPSSRVLALALSADARTVIIGSEDRIIKIWDLSTGFRKASLEGHIDLPFAVNISDDGRSIISGGSTGTLYLWDTTTTSVMNSIQGHVNRVRSATFSPDGNLVASASDDQMVHIWRATDLSHVNVLSGHEGRVTGVVFSPDGSLIASISEDKWIIVWDVGSYSLSHRLKGHEDAVHSVAFSHDSKFLASASSDSTVRLWDAVRGTFQMAFESYHNIFQSISFAQNQRNIVSGGSDGVIRVWDWKGAEGNLIRTTLKHNGCVKVVKFSPDGMLLASSGSDGGVHLWDTAKMTYRSSLEDSPEILTVLEFSEDNKRLTGSSLWETATWDLATSRRIDTPAPPAGQPSDQPMEFPTIYQTYVSKESLLDRPNQPDMGSWLQLSGNSLYVRQYSFDPHQETTLRFICNLPIPSISTHTSHGYQLALGTHGGQVILLDFSLLINSQSLPSTNPSVVREWIGGFNLPFM